MEVYFNDPPINLPGIERRLHALGFTKAKACAAEWNRLCIKGLTTRATNDMLCNIVDAARKEYERKVSSEFRGPKKGKK